MLTISVTTKGCITLTNYPYRNIISPTWKLFPQVLPILRAAREAKITLAIASRGRKADLYRQFLHLIPSGLKEPKTALGFFHKDMRQIFATQERGKIKHLENIKKAEGGLYQYTDMLLFDDDERNNDVTNLGVTFQPIGPSGYKATRGMKTPVPLTFDTIDEGVRRWRQQNGHPAVVNQPEVGQPGPSGTQQDPEGQHQLPIRPVRPSTDPPHHPPPAQGRRPPQKRQRTHY